MLIPEIAEQIINKIGLDAYNRVSAVLLIDKPAGVTSHDIVDDVRKVLRTRKVGHAGALDPFASGLLVVLVGKYTRYTEALIQQDKSYLAEVTLGLSTTTQDPEGTVVQQSDTFLSDLPDSVELTKTLQAKFMPGYDQQVPLYSSVKVSGHKLRSLARSATSIEKLESGNLLIKLPGKNGAVEEFELELPIKNIKISKLECKEIAEVQGIKLDSKEVTGHFVSAKIEVACSKGTYIRQLAEDIGNVLGRPAFLSGLSRTRVGAFFLENALSVEQLYNQSKEIGIQTKELAELRLKTAELATDLS
jgi:tRNA pseudouridine55 synthase